jgi:hypothetical protein
LRCLALAAFIQSGVKSRFTNALVRFTISSCANHCFKVAEHLLHGRGHVTVRPDQSLQINRFTTIKLSLSLAVLGEALPLAFCPPCVTDRQSAVPEELAIFYLVARSQRSGPHADWNNSIC